MGFTDTKLLYLVGGGIVFLYILGALFMRNTHPYKGSWSEPFEAKQRRRRIGMFLVGTATLALGVVGLTAILVSRN